MKQLLLLLCISISCSIVTKAQFDEKFYFPKMKWDNIDSIKYEELTFKTDTLP